MSDSRRDVPDARWQTLSREVQSMKDTLNSSTLVGVLDRDTNHIASIQEEIDQKTREALVAYWLSDTRGEMPQGFA